MAIPPDDEITRKALRDMYATTPLNGLRWSDLAGTVGALDYLKSSPFKIDDAPWKAPKFAQPEPGVYEGAQHQFVSLPCDTN